MNSDYAVFLGLDVGKGVHPHRPRAWHSSWTVTPRPCLKVPHGAPLARRLATGSSRARAQPCLMKCPLKLIPAPHPGHPIPGARSRAPDPWRSILAPHPWHPYPERSIPGAPLLGLQPMGHQPMGLHPWHPVGPCPRPSAWSTAKPPSARRRLLHSSRSSAEVGLLRHRCHLHDQEPHHCSCAPRSASHKVRSRGRLACVPSARARSVRTHRPHAWVVGVR